MVNVTLSLAYLRNTVDGSIVSFKIVMHFIVFCLAFPMIAFWVSFSWLYSSNCGQTIGPFTTLSASLLLHNNVLHFHLREEIFMGC